MRNRNPDLQTAKQVAKDNAGLIAVAAGVGILGLLAFRRSAQAGEGEQTGEDAYSGDGESAYYGDPSGGAGVDGAGEDTSVVGADVAADVEYEVDPNSLLEQTIRQLPSDIQVFVRSIQGRRTNLKALDANITSVRTFAEALGTFMAGITLPPQTQCAVVGADAMQTPSGRDSVRELQFALNQLFSAIAEEQRRLRVLLETTVVGQGAIGPDHPGRAAAALKFAPDEDAWVVGLKTSLAIANLICGTQHSILPQTLGPNYPATMGKLLGYVTTADGRRVNASGIRPLASIDPLCGFTNAFLTDPAVRLIPASNRVSITTNRLTEPTQLFQLAVDGVYGPCTRQAQHRVYYLACHAGLPDLAYALTGVNPADGTSARSALNPSAVTGVLSNRNMLQALLITLATHWQTMGILEVSYDGPG